MNLIIRTAVAAVLVLVLGLAAGAVGGSTPDQLTAGPLPCCPPN